MSKAPRGALFTILALALGCFIAACGSASSSSSTTGSAGASSTSTTTSAATGAPGGTSASRTALVACLKSHGVTLPNRPAGAPPAGGTGTGTGTTGAGGPPGGGFFGGGSGSGGRRFANNPKLQAAFKACGANFGFRRGSFAGRISHTTITKYVDCVRQHGYNLPNPNFSGKGSVFPSNIRTNPKFVAASKACQSILVPARPSGGTSTNSGA
ncbi:MAG: hypothetical protein WAL38_02280 [Solirubrobacteraceae bacterium]